MNKDEFPAEIFVQLEKDGEEFWMLANEHAKDIADPKGPVRAARYALVDEVTVTVKTTIKVR